MTNMLLLTILFCTLCVVHSFTSLPSTRVAQPTVSLILASKNKNTVSSSNIALLMANDDGVVELADDEDTATKPVETPGAAPFLSQGEIADEALSLSNDPKQTRVIIYIILSLIPVLFLVPLMLGSRDLIPLDAMPPVDM